MTTPATGKSLATAWHLQNEEQVAKFFAVEKISPLSARVLRENEWLNLPAHELVPGDMVELSAGVVVPADIRLFETGKLGVDESVLTGESQMPGSRW